MTFVLQAECIVSRKNPIDLRLCFFVLPPLRDFVHATRRPLLFLPCADFRVVGVTWKGRRWRFEGRRRACRVAGGVYLKHQGCGTP